MQDSISDRFCDGRYEVAKTTERNFEELYEDIPHLIVAREERLNCVTSGNRRLYVCRKLEEFKRIVEIPVTFETLSDWRVNIFTD